MTGLAAQQLESTKYEGRDYHTINKCPEFLDLKWCLSIVYHPCVFPCAPGPNSIVTLPSSSTITSQLNVSFTITILSYQEVTKLTAAYSYQISESGSTNIML